MEEAQASVVTIERPRRASEVGQRSSPVRRAKTRSAGPRKGGLRSRTVTGGFRHGLGKDNAGWGTGWCRGIPPPSVQQIRSHKLQPACGLLGRKEPSAVVPPRPPSRTLERANTTASKPCTTSPPQEALNSIIKFPANERKQLLFFGPPGEVLTNLWVGSMEHATPANIKLWGYTTIISIMRYTVFGGPPTYPPEINFYNYPFCDNGTDNIPFSTIGTLIHECLSRGFRILVHCKQGISRSVSSIIAYLMMYKGLDYDEGLALIKQARPAANPKFAPQLRSLHSSLQRNVERGEAQQ
eukprot:TRINITY_DN5984_c0_g1_i1.p1 TRINITY_DN5984_c0_g1~~TRINITY_DN5984_c0_g1_i1.p1  ORF type:complete len:297 (+),score=40.42 TRINITY_DN5984_c0_g1_i1:65-955(+)